MAKKTLTKYENQVEEYLNGKSILELVKVLRYLDDEKPYAELLENCLGELR